VGTYQGDRLIEEAENDPNINLEKLASDEENSSEGSNPAL
jgi:hypothetical protein